MIEVLIIQLHELTTFVHDHLSDQDWFDVSYIQGQPPFKSTEIGTFLHTTFLMMNLFNQINCRRIYGERQVFDNLTSCTIFQVVWSLNFIIAVSNWDSTLISVLHFDAINVHFWILQSCNFINFPRFSFLILFFYVYFFRVLCSCNDN